jgi:hypothetical protein
VLKYLESESRIDRALYHYNYNSETTETQQHLKNKKKRIG